MSVEKRDQPGHRPYLREEMKRYYDEILDMDDNFTAFFAAQTLLEQSGLIANSGKLVNDYVRIPTSGDVVETQLYYDQLALLPFRVLGPEVEKHRTLDEIKAWYAHTIKRIQSGSDAHDASCVQEDGRSARTDLGCYASPLCPWRYVAFEIDSGVLYPDFSDQAYILEPLRQKDIVITKLQLGIKAGILDAEFQDRPLGLFLDQFIDYFGEE